MNHLHKLGFAHSDFKPDNIIVETDGQSIRLKGIDFASMSKLDGSEPRPTIGSDPYMSLDRCQGRETWSLLRDDRFALGVTIFMLGYFKYPFGQSEDKKPHSSCKEN